jgi:hypothetical protein
LFFCEKPDFKIEDLLGTFHEFSRQFVAAMDQNAARKAAAKKAEERKRAMESMQDKQKVIVEGAVIDSLVARVQMGDFSRGSSTASLSGASSSPKTMPKFARGVSSTPGGGARLTRIDEQPQPASFEQMMLEAARSSTVVGEPDNKSL